MSQINQAQETEGLQNVKSLEMMQRFFDLFDFFIIIVYYNTQRYK